MSTVSRRSFLHTSGIAAGSLALGASLTTPVHAAGGKPKLRKAVKIGMIRDGKSVEEKFTLIKRLGFEGVEINSPSTLDLDEANAAAKKTGIVIHGVVDSTHWQKRFSDASADVRAQAVADLRTALNDAKKVGAATVLVVPAKVTNPETENWQQCWDRSIAEISKTLPQARELGVKIGIETVWNDFITSPEHLINYVDAFKDPIVGAYFDCSNMLKYGVPSATWIRMLGKRLIKFDFKGYSHTNKWCKIGDGDENWPEVLKALDEVGYEGWATSEVGGGGEAELKDIAERMDRVLGLNS
jgi:hexulose-6-phosphate isomerase